jgi:FKBP-type peptidyl-prolyl cis-trans isomerase FklB
MLRIPVLALVAVAAFAADVAPAATETKTPAASVPAGTPAAAPAAESAPVDPKLADLSTKQKASYLIGTNMAGAVKEYGLDVKLVLQAIDDTVAGKPSLIPKEEAQEVFAKFQAEVDAAKSKQGESRKAGNATWLAENAKKPNIKVTASGLQYEVVAATTKKDAKKPTAADQVKVNYVGALTDGTVFDASANHGGPATFGVGQVIKGWTEALQLMSEGDKYKLYIPSELAYGENGPPSIGANQILVFDVELVSVEGAAGPATFKP